MLYNEDETVWLTAKACTGALAFQRHYEACDVYCRDAFGRMLNPWTLLTVFRLRECGRRIVTQTTRGLDRLERQVRLGWRTS